MADKKFTYDDLLPRVELLIDALENKGSYASGTPYNTGVSDKAKLYKALLTEVREKRHAFERLLYDLQDYKFQTLQLIGNNQRYRIIQILEALDYYFIQEYHKVNK